MVMESDGVRAGGFESPGVWERIRSALDIQVVTRWKSLEQRGLLDR